MKKLNLILSVCLVLLLVMSTETFAQKKGKKEKKEAFEWVMPEEMSGNEVVDDYLRTCDTLWTRVQAYREDISKYKFTRLDTIEAESGEKYEVIAMIDSSSFQQDGTVAFMSRGTSTWQFIETVSSGMGLSLDIVNMTAATALATAELPKLKLKALTYAKYLKAGPNIIGKAGKEISEVVRERKQQVRDLRDWRKQNVKIAAVEGWSQEKLDFVRKNCFIVPIVKVQDSGTKEMIKEEQKFSVESCKNLGKLIADNARQAPEEADKSVPDGKELNDEINSAA